MSVVSAAMGPRVRKARVEELLRRVRRRCLFDREKRAKVNEALALLAGDKGDDFASDFLDEAENRFDAYLAADGEDSTTPVIDFVKWLLEWFVEHADEIIAIITTLIPLFV